MWIAPEELHTWLILWNIYEINMKLLTVLCWDCSCFILFLNNIVFDMSVIWRLIKLCPQSCVSFCAFLSEGSEEMEGGRWSREWQRKERKGKRESKSENILFSGCICFANVESTYYWENDCFNVVHSWTPTRCPNKQPPKNNKFLQTLLIHCTNHNHLIFILN